MRKKSFWKILLSVIFPLILIVSIGSGFGYWVYGANIQQNTKLNITSPNVSSKTYVSLGTMTNCNILKSLTLQKVDKMKSTPILSTFLCGDFATSDQVYQSDTYVKRWNESYDHIYFRKNYGFYHNNYILNSWIGTGSEVPNPVITDIEFKAIDNITYHFTNTNMESTIKVTYNGSTYYYTCEITYTSSKNIQNVEIKQYTVTAS